MCVCVCVCVLFAQLCLTLCDSIDCSLPGSFVRVLQARILEWVAITFSRGSSQPRDRTWVSCIVGRCFTIWATREDSHNLVNIPKKQWIILFNGWIVQCMNYISIKLVKNIYIDTLQQLCLLPLPKSTALDNVLSISAFLMPSRGTHSRHAVTIA